ncbi:MAG: HAD domain-containing protein [Pseudomonadota bacterium]
MTGKPILYLDYDGILHPTDVRVSPDEPLRPRVYVRGQPTDWSLFEHLTLLENLLAPYPELNIILATSWVREFGYQFSLAQLTPGLQNRVIGATLYPAPARYFCIQIDADERGLERWLALDDDLNCWPESEMHRVVAPTDQLRGLAQPGIAEELADKLRLLYD